MGAMPEQFLHGVEVQESNEGLNTVRTVKSSVIGIVGTAESADATEFPLDTPVLVNAGSTKTALLGDSFLKSALDGVADQIGSSIVVIRVEAGADDDDTKANIVGDAATYKGLWALLAAKNEVGYQPRLIVSEFSSDQTVAAEMEVVAQRLRAIAIVDGPGTDQAEAIAYQANFGERVYMVDPQVRINDTDYEPTSARAAGVIARIDRDQGFWNSPSNKRLYGIVGLSRPVDFVLGDTDCEANQLNENNVTTIIREDGFRLWGNRTCDGTFLCVRRTRDILNDSLQRAHMWALDRGITKSYVTEVAANVNAYLRTLKALGAIFDGFCWPDPELNSPANIAQGKTYFNFDFAPVYPSEHITFLSIINNGYLEDIV